MSGFLLFLRDNVFEHIVEPNRRSGVEVDVFCHSWHPELSDVIDKLYQPVRSQHQRLVRSLDKVRSQHLSMARGLALIDEAARSSPSALPHALVAVLRYDIVFYSALLFGPLVRSPLWLPRWCGLSKLSSEQGKLVRGACGNSEGRGEGFLTRPVRLSEMFMRPGSAHKNMSEGADQSYLTMDWWFIATPDVARSFGSIYERAEAYTARISRLGSMPVYSHQLCTPRPRLTPRLRDRSPTRGRTFSSHASAYGSPRVRAGAFHINNVLRLGAAVRFVKTASVDFRLARQWRYGPYCRPQLSGDLATRVTALAAAVAPRLPRQAVSSGATNIAWACPARLAVFCPWYSPPCAPQMQRYVLAMESRVAALVNLTTTLPPRLLHARRLVLETKAKLRVPADAAAALAAASADLQRHGFASHGLAAQPVAGRRAERRGQATRAAAEGTVRAEPTLAERRAGRVGGGAGGRGKKSGGVGSRSRAERGSVGRGAGRTPI